MDDRLGQARSLLAKTILQDFKDKITGAREETVVGENPENKFFVGKLLSHDDDSNNGFSSDVFIKSIGADFYIKEEEFSCAKITIFPRGEFYYRCYPTLEQQQEAMLEEINNSSEENYGSFEELLCACDADPDKFGDYKIKLIPVYKKFSIEDPNVYISFEPSKLMDSSGSYGRLDETSALNIDLMDQIYDLMEQLNEDEQRYIHQITAKTAISDLRSWETFKNFIARSGKKDINIQQKWHVYFYVQIRKVHDNYLISVAFINDSEAQSNSTTHQSNKYDNDKPTIETLFNSGIDIQMEGAEFEPFTLDYFLDDYKYDNEQKAVGLNCSIEFDEITNTISTNHLPTYEQKRLITKKELDVAFQALIDEPEETLSQIKEKMDIELEKWWNQYSQKGPLLTPVGQAKMKKEIEDFNWEIQRFQFGIETIKNYPMVRDSFILMNKAFQKTASKYKTWRLFQIVFIVSVIPDIVACDDGIMTEEEKERTMLDRVSLLYFPTGGGKTEAFLGVLVFNLFFDRYRGKTCGVTAFLHYPLRLLSIQQVQRVANTLAQAELLRREDPAISETEEFSLGYFTGVKNTPNDINGDTAVNYINMDQDEIDKQRILDICPFCGQATVHLKFDKETYRLMHVCSNPDCQAKGPLPIYMVDSEIYRYLPSTIISTVDKLAILGQNRNFRSLLAGASIRCPKHGFTTTNKCLVSGKSQYSCSEEVQNFETVDMYDPAPTLFIQDELHLIRESLGTYASHYESFVDYFIQNVSPSRRKAKIIGASATISHYEDQITQLYGRDPQRFPCSSISLQEDFYSRIDPDDTQRFIMGYAPFGKAMMTSTVYCLKYLREVIFKYVRDPKEVLKITDMPAISEDEVKKILEDYWIFLEYNNEKRTGNNLEGALQDPINVELEKEGVPTFNIRKMTGDESFQDVRSLLAEVENTKDVYEGVNIITATSMLSHGVDADRFNVMLFYGIPGNTAEYIQAYSRTGRKYSSIVIDAIRPFRETDMSYLRNFVKFHEYKDLLVEPVPLNRWATKAIEKTLPGIFSGLLLDQYDPDLQFEIGSLWWMNNIKSAIEKGALEKEKVLQQLLQIYRCEVDSDVKDIGNQYREYIVEFVNIIFEKIMDRNWVDRESITKGLEQMGFPTMTNLRDTDTQLIVGLE